ncbi:MAG: cell wall metabolism sensor histidine kinase WalK [Chloroflexi bacterium]|nr:MAG: cell wall metabolism sensor histidine kinase WalK [Chloroflexota bacterium]
MTCSTSRACNGVSCTCNTPAFTWPMCWRNACARRRSARKNIPFTWILRPRIARSWRINYVLARSSAISLITPSSFPRRASKSQSNDEGIGVSPEFFVHIFERFYRVRNATSRQYSGIGMGLYVAKAIVEAHGGRIWLSSHQGTGSTFYFTLPRVPRTSTLPAP